MAVMLALAFVLTAGAAPPPQRVAIVGGGLAGLGTAVHLLTDAPLEALHVYDAALPGEGGASAVAAGLLHAFSRTGGEIWEGAAGFEATSALLARVEALVGPCSTQNGLLRLAMNDEQAAELRARDTSDEQASGASDEQAAELPSATRRDVPAASLEQRWMTPAEASRLALPSAASSAGVGGLGASYANAAMSIDVPRYLRGMWSLCEELGGEASEGEVVAQWRVGELASLDSLLPSYDAIIVALGAKATSLRGCESLPLRGCRGQNLIMSNEAKLAVPLISGKYIVPLTDDRLLCGATFEYEVSTLHAPADCDATHEAIGATLQKIHPSIEGESVLGCQAGVRALPPRTHFGYVPIAGRLGATESTADGTADGSSSSSDGGAEGAECWLLGGLGSRGLIHHALLGQQTARAVLSRDATLLPAHTRRQQPRLDDCRVGSGVRL